MSAPPTREKLFSVYFDTRKFTLRKHGLMLRVRHKGDKRWQTIKANTALGPFGRQEWEEEIGGDRPDMQHAKGTALARFDLKSLKHDLTSVFETDVTRTAMPLRYITAAKWKSLSITAWCEPANGGNLSAKSRSS